MKKKELQEWLESLPENFDDVEIVLSCDSEGNHFSPLYSCDENNIFQANNAWDYDVRSTSFSAEDVDLDEDEWERLKKEQSQCIVLWPLN